MPFMHHSCDGIFTNYVWKPEYVSESCSTAGPERKFSVFSGIDIFGRSTFGGGGYDTHKVI